MDTGIRTLTTADVIVGMGTWTAADTEAEAKTEMRLAADTDADTDMGLDVGMKTEQAMDK